MAGQYDLQLGVQFDTSGMTAGTRRVRSEMANLAQTGIAGFEQLRTKVAALTAQYVDLRKQQQAATDPADMARLGAAADRTQQQLSMARQELRGLRTAGQQGNETLGILAGTLGVTLPAGLERVIGRSPAVQKALESAFSGAVVGSLIGALEMAIFKTEWFTHLLGGLTDAELAASKKASDEIVHAEGMILAKQGELNVARATGIDKTKAEGQVALDSLHHQLESMDNVTGAQRDHLMLLQGEINQAKLLTEQKKLDEEAAKKAQEAANRRAEAAKSLNQILLTAAADRAGIEGFAEDKIRMEAEKTFAQISDIERKYPKLHQDAEAARLAVTEDAEAKITELHRKTLQAAADSDNKAAEEYGKQMDQAVKTANEGQLAAMRSMQESRKGLTFETAAGIERIEYDSAQRILKVNEEAEDARRKLLDGRVLDMEQISSAEQSIEQKRAAAVAAINAEEGAKIMAEQQKGVERLAGQIDSFIDRVFLQAKSLSDVFHQFLMQLLGSFVKWVSNMIAQAIVGMKQLSSAQQSGGGGILGSILGGILGIPQAARAGTTVAGVAGVPAIQNVAPVAAAIAGGGVTVGGVAGVPAIQNLAAAAAAVGGVAVAPTGVEAAFTGPLQAGAITPLIAQQGAFPEATGAPGAPQVVGGATTGLSSLAQQWATMGPLAKLLVSGGILGGTTLVAQGFGQGSILKGAIGGGLLGVSSAAMAGLLFTPYGAIAAGVYAAVGALIGWIGEGRAKRKAAALEQGFEFAADDLYKQFEQRETDYESALAGMQAIIVQGQQTLLGAGLGKAGKRGAENLTGVIQDEIKALEKLEKEREARTDIISGMTLPEFHSGGIIGSPLATRHSPLPSLHEGGVTAAWGLSHDEVVAVLKRGEGVVNVEGMRHLGEVGLAAINRAPRFHDGGSVTLSPAAPGSAAGAPSTESRTPVVVHVNFQAFDGPSMQSWWRANQANVVRTLRRAIRDGA